MGSPLRTLDARDVITSDCKEYDEAGVRFSVAQIEELGFRTFRAKHEELAAALDEFCRNQRLFFSALLVTDINTQNSVLLVSGAEEFRQQIDYPSGRARLVAARWSGVAQEAAFAVFVAAIAGDADERELKFPPRAVVSKHGGRDASPTGPNFGLDDLDPNGAFSRKSWDPSEPRPPPIYSRI